MSGITRSKATGSAGQPAAGRRAWRFGPETAALGVLLTGASLGLVLWAKWGFLIALQTITRFCF